MMKKLNFHKRMTALAIALFLAFVMAMSFLPVTAFGNQADNLARMVGGGPATLPRDTYQEISGTSNTNHVRSIQFRASDFGDGTHWALVTGGRVAAFLPITATGTTPDRTTSVIPDEFHPDGFNPVTMPGTLNAEVLFGGASGPWGATAPAISVEFHPGGGGGGGLRNGLVLVHINAAASDYATAVVSMPVWYRTRVNADQLWNSTSGDLIRPTWGDRNDPVQMTFSWSGLGTAAPIVLANRRADGGFSFSYPSADIPIFEYGAVNLPGQIRISEQVAGSFHSNGGRPWMVRLTLDRGFSWGPSPAVNADGNLVYAGNALWPHGQNRFVAAVHGERGMTGLGNWEFPGTFALPGPAPTPPPVMHSGAVLESLGIVNDSALPGFGPVNRVVRAEWNPALGSIERQCSIDFYLDFGTPDRPGRLADQIRFANMTVVAEEHARSGDVMVEVEVFRIDENGHYEREGRGTVAVADFGDDLVVVVPDTVGEGPGRGVPVSVLSNRGISEFTMDVRLPANFELHSVYNSNINDEPPGYNVLRVTNTSDIAEANRRGYVTLQFAPWHNGPNNATGIAAYLRGTRTDGRNLSFGVRVTNALDPEGRPLTASGYPAFGDPPAPPVTGRPRPPRPAGVGSGIGGGRWRPVQRAAAIVPAESPASRPPVMTSPTPMPPTAEQPLQPITPPPTTVIFTIGNTVYTVNGTPQIIEAAPFIRNGRAYVPLRALAESLGGTVAWSEATRTAAVTLGTRFVSVQLDTPLAGGYGIPEIINGRIIVPTRWVAEQLGAVVDWNEAAQTVTVNLIG